MKSIDEDLGDVFSNVQETNEASILQWTIKQQEVFLELNKLLK